MKRKKKNSNIFTIMISIVSALLIISIFTQGFTNNPITKNVQLTGDTLLILNDERCTGPECDITQIITSLQEVFPDLEYEILDYNSNQGKEIYQDLELSVLPAILFLPSVSEQEGYESISPYLIEIGDFLSLQIGATFNPESEICTNGKDDDGNKLTDCEDSACSEEWVCMPKQTIPEVELFIMSYCPYGTQTQKGIIPVMETLGDKADIQIKFVDYIMHGLDEINENLIQYCIQKTQNNLYLDYAKCFLDEGKSEECITETGINTEELNSCIASTDDQFQISALFADQSTWVSNQFPQFNIHRDLNDEYGVQGSPTLIINGVKSSVSRSPAALLEAVCYGFEDEPEECEIQLSTETPSAGFGFNSGSSSTGGCEV